MTEHEKAKVWRLKNNLTMDALSELIGWSPSSILCMERGISPPTKRGERNQPVNEHAWFRYKLCCFAVNQMKKQKNKNWNWE